MKRLLTIMVLIILYSCNDKKMPLPANYYATKNYTPHMEMYEVAKAEVLLNLKSPLTAIFPSKDIILTQVEWGGVGVWNINSYVDSQNSFGALLRTKFYCKVLVSKDGETKVSELKFIEQ